MTILENGKPKSGIYKIQNIHSGTYLDIEVHSRTVCCPPERDLDQGRGLVRLDILHLGSGIRLSVVGTQTVWGWIYGAEGGLADLI